MNKLIINLILSIDSEYCLLIYYYKEIGQTVVNIEFKTVEYYYFCFLRQSLPVCRFVTLEVNIQR